MIFLDQWLKRLGLMALAVGACVLAALVIARRTDNGGPIPTPEQVQDAGAVPVEDASARRVAALVRENDSLRAQLERVRKSFPKVQPIATGCVVTKAEPAHGPARPDPAPAPGCPVDALPPCLLRDGDLAEVRATGALLDFGGRRGLIGAAEFWRMTPPPPAKIWGGDLNVDAGEIAAVPQPKPTRWMAGPAVGVSGNGPMFGAVLITPERRVWRLSGRGMAGVMAGEGDGAVWCGVAFEWGGKR